MQLRGSIPSCGGTGNEADSPSARYSPAAVRASVHRTPRSLLCPSFRHHGRNRGAGPVQVRPNVRLHLAALQRAASEVPGEKSPNLRQARGAHACRQTRRRRRHRYGGPLFVLNLIRQVSRSLCGQPRCPGCPLPACPSFAHRYRRPLRTSDQHEEAPRGDPRPRALARDGGSPGARCMTVNPAPPAIL